MKLTTAIYNQTINTINNIDALQYILSYLFTHSNIIVVNREWLTIVEEYRRRSIRERRGIWRALSNIEPTITISNNNNILSITYFKQYNNHQYNKLIRYTIQPETTITDSNIDDVLDKSTLKGYTEEYITQSMFCDRTTVDFETVWMQTYIDNANDYVYEKKGYSTITHRLIVHNIIVDDMIYGRVYDDIGNLSSIHLPYHKRYYEEGRLLSDVRWWVYSANDDGDIDRVLCDRQTYNILGEVLERTITLYKMNMHDTMMSMGEELNINGMIIMGEDTKRYSRYGDIIRHNYYMVLDRKVRISLLDDSFIVDKLREPVGLGLFSDRAIKALCKKVGLERHKL